MNEKTLNSRKTDEMLPAGVFFNRSYGLYCGSDLDSQILALELNNNNIITQSNSILQKLDKMDRARHRYLAS